MVPQWRSLHYTRMGEISRRIEGQYRGCRVLLQWRLVLPALRHAADQALYPTRESPFGLRQVGDDEHHPLVSSLPGIRLRWYYGERRRMPHRWQVVPDPLRQGEESPGRRIQAAGHHRRLQSEFVPLLYRQRHRIRSSVCLSCDFPARLARSGLQGSSSRSAWSGTFPFFQRPMGGTDGEHADGSSHPALAGSHFRTGCAPRLGL